jgi:regulator of RNase E activity RraA
MIGFRILARQRCVAADIAARFAKLPVANISDSMARMTAAGPRLRPMHNTAATAVMVGPALTVKTRPGDNLMLHKALDLAVAGDVIVCDGGGDLTNSLIGEIMLSIAVKKKLGGVVINGSIRDSAWVRQSAFPVFAAGVSHRGPYKDGPGEINVAIAIDGMVIEPGDLIIGDDDGMLAVPYEQCAGVLAATEVKQAAEVKTMADIAAGRLDRSWVDASLKRLGCGGV